MLAARQTLAAFSKQHLIWELSDYSVLNAAIFYWRLSHGLRSANAIESSKRPAFDEPEQYLCE